MKKTPRDRSGWNRSPSQHWSTLPEGSSRTVSATSQHTFQICSFVAIINHCLGPPQHDWLSLLTHFGKHLSVCQDFQILMSVLLFEATSNATRLPRVTSDRLGGLPVTEWGPQLFAPLQRPWWSLMCKVLTCSHGDVVYSSTPAACGAQLPEWIQWCSTPSSSSIVFLMEYYPATTAMAMPSPYVMPQPVEGAYMTASPYMAYDGYAASPYMPAMPAMPMSGLDGLDHSQGKWFAPGEALPPGLWLRHTLKATQPLKRATPWPTWPARALWSPPALQLLQSRLHLLRARREAWIKKRRRWCFFGFEGLH